MSAQIDIGTKAKAGAARNEFNTPYGTLIQVAMGAEGQEKMYVFREEEKFFLALRR